MSTKVALPGVLAEIAEVVGYRTAIALALEWGGEDVHFPKPDYLAQHPGHPLAQVLADEGTAALIAHHYGGGNVYVPQARGACTVALAADGLSPCEIATRLNLSPRSVRRYLRAA